MLICGCSRGRGAGNEVPRATAAVQDPAPIITHKAEPENDSPRRVPNDSWYRSPPEEFYPYKHPTELAKDQFSLVTRNEAEALKKLATSSHVKLSSAEAKQFTGREFDEAGSQLVLLRALALHEKTGAFSITRVADKVRVHHGCLGRTPVTQTRRAIVVRLPALPTEVYVDCGMVE
jgi:hypothetical protein